MIWQVLIKKKEKSNLENFPIDLHNALNIRKELSL